MILGLVDEAVQAGACQEKACDLINLGARTLQRWREQGIGHDRRAGPKHPPANKLGPAERAHALEVANAPEYRDLSPKQIVPRLADLGLYICSESTFYRILHAANQIHHRESSRPPTKRHRPTAYVATGPNQVWSWDITYIQTVVRGRFFYLYVAMDVWSRKIVGWTIETEESTERAQAMLSAAFEREDVRPGRLVIHSDNGGPMKAATMLAFLQGLGVVTSFSRPSVSNDNPYSESLFRTTKSRPEFPSTPFETIEQACCWMTWFENWYNTEHLHSALKFVTPAQRHAGEDVEILEHRAALYERARKRNPKRWSKNVRDWTRVETVVLNPDPSAAEIQSEAA